MEFASHGVCQGVQLMPKSCCRWLPALYALGSGLP